MLGPLVILAILSVGGGWMGPRRFDAFLSPSVGKTTADLSGAFEYLMIALAVAAGLLGWYIAHRMYHRPKTADGLAPGAPAGHSLLAHKYYVDEIYSWTFIKPLLAFSKYVLEWIVDVAILGGAVWLLAGVVSLGGAMLQRWQSGNLRSYAAWLALGAAVLLYFVLAPHIFPGATLHLGMAGH
jgi:NADH-quinone oxidoreductase subunit L